MNAEIRDLNWGQQKQRRAIARPRAGRRLIVLALPSPLRAVVIPDLESSFNKDNTEML